MIVRVDIDGTICRTHGCDYLAAEPMMDRIERVNALHDAGHTVVYWTARGALTGIDWHGATLAQLRRWGCRFSSLECTKPHFDVFVDDKAFNAMDFDAFLKAAGQQQPSCPRP